MSVSSALDHRRSWHRTRSTGGAMSEPHGHPTSCWRWDGLSVSNVFISYRREDSAPYAGRICDRLSDAFGSGHVFMDVDDITPGTDFAEAIDRTVSACDVLVAVI